MKTKKYIVLDLENIDGGHKLTLKVVNGFLRSNVETALDIQKDWTPLGENAAGKALDRLYFLPGCAVPRFKVREKYSCTIKAENATAAFVSKDYLTSSDSTLTHFKGVLRIKTPILKQWLDTVHQPHIAMLFNSLTTQPYEGVYLGQNLWWNARYNSKLAPETIVKKVLDPSGINAHAQKGRITSNEFQILGLIRKGALEDLTCPIYLEEELLALLNSDSVTIDVEKYQEFRAFGRTADKENLILLMELMSNCNFTDSVVYLLFLLKEFGYLMESLKESNHVNFKSLLNFLELDPKDFKNVSIMDMTRALQEHNQFTETNAMRVSMLYAGDRFEYNDVSMKIDGQAVWTQGPVIRKEVELNN